MAKIRMADQKKPTRQKMLQEFCRSKGWALPNDGWDVGAASVFFGKPTNKMGDLLRGQGSFGPQIARELEENSKGELAPLQLDGIELSGSKFLDWPFSEALERAVGALDPEGLFRAENVLRSHLGMDQLPRPSGGFGDHTEDNKPQKFA